MEAEKEEKTYLVVGIDESNHFSELYQGAGIVAAVFSRDIDDGLYKAYSRKKDDEKKALLKEWMNESHRDYRFITMTNSEIRRFQPISSVMTAPLIKSYVGCLKAANIGVPGNLRLFVDGILSANHREHLENIFLEDFETVIIRNLIKRDRIYAARRKGRKLVGPKAIEIADILAYELYHGRDPNQNNLSLDQLFGHHKRVMVDEEIILKSIREEKASRIKY